MSSLCAPLLLLSFLLQPPTRPAPLGAELREVLADLPLDEHGWPEASDELAPHLRRLWSLLGRKAAVELQARPELAPDELAARIEQFEVEAGVPEGQRYLVATAVQLAGGERAAFAVAVRWAWTGTFFVVARRDGVFREVWNIKEPAERHYASRDEIGYWAYLGAGFHDGAINGSIHQLPAGPGGQARFYVDAISHPGMGLTRPAQLSVWQWDGIEPRCLFIDSYPVVFEAEVRLQGDLLSFRSMSRLETTGICGSCRYDAPMDVRTLRLTAAGVEDLGLAPEMPELTLADRLLARRLDRQPAPELATPEAIAQLDDVLESLRDPEYGVAVGMLYGWHVETQAGRRVLLMATDELGTIGYTVEHRDGRPVVTEVRLLQPPG